MKILIVSGTQNSFVGRIINVDICEDNSYIKLPELTESFSYLVKRNGDRVKFINSHITLIGIIQNE